MKRLYEYVLVVIGVLCMGACQSEEYSETDPEVVKGPGLYFSLNAVGGENSLSTRTMPDDESKISNIYVLYFQKGSGTGDDDDYTYIGQETISVNGNLSSATEYKLNTPTVVDNAASTTQDWKVVFFANAAPTTSSGQKLSAFKAAQQITLTNVLWWGSTNLITSSDLIPMYCCTEAVKLPKRPYTKIYYVNSSNIEVSQTYYLLRMMAKFSIINTKLTTFNTDQYNFEITDISVENGYATGFVCYNTTVSGSGANVRISAETVLSSWTPSNSATTPITPAWTNISSTETQTISSFYTFERGVSNNAFDNKTNCYIKLQGYRFKSATEKDGSKSEYMLPIYAINSDLTVDPTKAGPILRNHHYKYTISGVHNYALRVSLGVANWIPVNIAADPIPLR